MSKEAVYLITEKSGLRRVVKKTDAMRAYLNNFNFANPDNQLKWVESTEDDAINEIKTNGQYLQQVDSRAIAIQQVLSDKDAEIEALKRQLAEANGIVPLQPASEIIAKINQAETKAEIDELIKNDTRKTVQDAALKAKLKLV